MIRSVLGDRWKDGAPCDQRPLRPRLHRAGRSRRGGRPRPLLYGVLLAYCVAQILSWLPFTPGGLGFVEAGLTGTLVLAGVNAADAVVATLAYRLVSYWLPLPAGLVAWFVHRRRYGSERAGTHRVTTGATEKMAGMLPADVA